VETIEKRTQSLRGAHLWLVLWKAFDALQVHALENIHSLGLGLSDFGVLKVLLHKGPLPVNAIARRSGSQAARSVSRSTVWKKKAWSSARTILKTAARGSFT
jgi:hypothetical protein